MLGELPSSFESSTKTVADKTYRINLRIKLGMNIRMNLRMNIEMNRQMNSKPFESFKWPLEREADGTV